MPVAGRQSACAYVQGMVHIYLSGGQNCSCIITCLKGEMAVKEHLDADPHMEGSRCVEDSFTVELNHVALWPQNLSTVACNSTGSQSSKGKEKLLSFFET